MSADVEGDDAAEANDRLVSGFLQAWERRDTDHILECFTDDAVYHSTPLTPIVGKAAIAAFVAGFEGKPPGCLTIRHQVASATTVMNERIDEITLNGKPVTLPIMGVFDIEGGRIKAWREYFDLGPVRVAYSTE